MESMDSMLPPEVRQNPPEDYLLSRLYIDDARSMLKCATAYACFDVVSILQYLACFPSQLMYFSRRGDGA